MSTFIKSSVGYSPCGGSCTWKRSHSVSTCRGSMQLGMHDVLIHMKVSWRAHAHSTCDAQAVSVQSMSTFMKSSVGDSPLWWVLHLERTSCGTGKKAEANIPCPQCTKMFTLPNTVEKHIRQVHLKIKNMMCHFCDYKTYSRFNLNLHVTKMHEGKKMGKQQCIHCDKTPFALDYHMVTYHNDKM